MKERAREAALDFAGCLPWIAWLAASGLAAGYASTGVMLLVWFGGFGLLIAWSTWDGDWRSAIAVGLSPILVIVGWIVFVLLLVLLWSQFGT